MEVQPSLKDLPEADQQRIQEFRLHLSDEMAVADAGALMARLAEEETLRSDVAGSIGYCMGGRHVLRVAAAYPGLFRANASLHPTRLVVDGSESPPPGRPATSEENFMRGSARRITTRRAMSLRGCVRPSTANPRSIPTRCMRVSPTDNAIPDRDVL